MPLVRTHRVIAADVHAVPRPFRAFAVRSDEPRHAGDARAPLGCVHVVQAALGDAGALARLAALGLARVRLEATGDIDHATATPQDLVHAAPGQPAPAERIAQALALTGVRGDDPAAYRASVAGHLHFLGAWGAGFHNDVARHWPGCLFWLLVLQADDVEFVMPHAGVRLPLAPGDLVVFDQTMAHGLCRPRDQGQAVAASFDAGAHRHQVFLTGELPLTDAQWAALGAPWLPVEVHAQRGALDLRVAQFDECSGAIQRVRALQHCMARDVDRPVER